jgi:hypothetical protein
MAPNKKGGKGKGESKTGAAVRVLDDDEEEKIQVRRNFLLSLFYNVTPRAADDEIGKIFSCSFFFDG